MILGLLFDNFNLKEDNLENKVLKIQSGEENLRNEILDEYKPFVLKSISKVCKRYIKTSDEEFSIGLLALNESIDSFSPDKNSSFLSFANLIIHRRMVDYIRKEKRHQHISLESYKGIDEDNTEHTQEGIKSSIAEHQLQEENKCRYEEIIHFKEQLKSFKISLSKLVDISPKHIDTRKQCMEIAKTACNNEDIISKLINKKRLPLKDLEPIVSVSRKTLERHRIYIIALIIIQIENYEYLKDYLK